MRAPWPDISTKLVTIQKTTKPRNNKWLHGTTTHSSNQASFMWCFFWCLLFAKLGGERALCIALVCYFSLVFKKDLLILRFGRYVSAWKEIFDPSKHTVAMQACLQQVYLTAGKCWSNSSNLIWPFSPQKVGFSKGNPRKFQGNLGWWNIIIWPEV